VGRWPAAAAAAATCYTAAAAATCYAAAAAAHLLLPTTRPHPSLRREVRIVLEGVADKSNAVLGSVFYPDGDKPANLAEALVTAGLARVSGRQGGELGEGQRVRASALCMRACGGCRSSGG
jgi:hypothetical protein